MPCSFCNIVPSSPNQNPEKDKVHDQHPDYNTYDTTTVVFFKGNCSITIQSTGLYCWLSIFTTDSNNKQLIIMGSSMTYYIWQPKMLHCLVIKHFPFCNAQEMARMKTITSVDSWHGSSNSCTSNKIISWVSHLFRHKIVPRKEKIFPQNYVSVNKFKNGTPVEIFQPHHDCQLEKLNYSKVGLKRQTHLLQCQGHL